MKSLNSTIKIKFVEHIKMNIVQQACNICFLKENLVEHLSTDPINIPKQGKGSNIV